MPQTRDLLSCDARLRVERVQAHGVAPQWSPVYAAPSYRLVFPHNPAAMEMLTQGELLLGDSLTVLGLASAQAYRMRPCARQERVSVVVSAPAMAAAHPAGEAQLPPPASWLLPVRSLYLLRRHWSRLATGRDEARETPVLVAAALASGRDARSTGAVARARRALATQADMLATGSVHDIADAAHSSAFHLARSFRRQTGWSLQPYRQQLRLAAALARLEDGERDLAGLAHDLGFCSQSHLGAVFHREVGVTPGQARRALSRAG